MELSQTWASPSRGRVPGGCCCINLLPPPNAPGTSGLTISLAVRVLWAPWAQRAVLLVLPGRCFSQVQSDGDQAGSPGGVSVNPKPGHLSYSRLFQSPSLLSPPRPFPRLQGPGCPKVFQEGRSRSSQLSSRLSLALVHHHVCVLLVSIRLPQTCGRKPHEGVNPRRCGSLGPSLRLATTNSIYFIGLL